MSRFMKNFTNEFMDYWLKIFTSNTNVHEHDELISIRLRKIINILTLCWPNPEQFIDNICKSEDLKECIRHNEFVKKKGISKNSTK